MNELKAGDPAPDFELPDGEGKVWRLGDLSGQKVILYFYPIDDTPGCTAEACDFRDSYRGLQDAGYLVLGVNPQDAESHRAFSDKYSLNFPLLIDEESAVADRYGAWGEIEAYGNTYIGLKRSTFVIDEKGNLEQAMYNVKAKGHVARLRETLGV